MRVLLAGSTGVIGSELRRQLIDAGHEVVGIARSERADLPVDILDREALLRAVDGERFDAVIHHAAALGAPPLTLAGMHRANRLRTEGTSALLAAARVTKARRFVAASPFYGYGFLDHGDEPLDETVPFAVPTGSRLDAVQLAVASTEQQVRAAGGIVLRHGLVYGQAVPVVAAGWQGRLPLLSSGDAAAAAVAALRRGKRGAAYNIADDAPASWADLQRATAVAVGAPRPRPVPRWLLRLGAPFAGEIAAHTAMRLSTAAARRDLRWRPRVPSYVEGLAATVDVATPA